MDAHQGCFFHSRFSLSDGHAAIRPLSDFGNNSRIVRKYRHCRDHLSRSLTSVSLVWVLGHSNILRDCRAYELARAGALIPESSLIELGMVCHLPWSSWTLSRNSFGTPTYPGSISSPATLQDSFGL